MKKILPAQVIIPAQVVLECKRIAAEFQKIDGKLWTDNDVFEMALNVGLDALGQRIKHEKALQESRKRAPVVSISGGVRHVH